MMMKRHEVWRQRYRVSRDLDHLTIDELSERLHDCINNLRTRTSNGKIGIRSPREGVGETWMSLFTEILEECHLRDYPYPGPITIEKFKSAMDHALDPIPDMDRVLDFHGLEKKPYLVKFGESRWLTAAIRTGKFRIASASYYDSAEHNHARRDTELERYIRTRSSDFGNKTIGPRGEWTSVRSPTDYYLFSLSELYTPRLFGDFAADSCLVIFDPKTFLSRLARATSHYLPQWQIQFNRVKYYDPVRIDPTKIIVPMWKPFRHAYQEEVRLLCLPPNSSTGLPPFEIELGPLEDCAVFVEIASHPSKLQLHDSHDDPVQRFGTTREESNMLNHLPDAAKVQGVVFNKEGSQHTDWYFQVQYTDAKEVWHELKIPMLDGLYLLNLLKTAEREQGLSLWNRS